MGRKHLCRSKLIAQAVVGLTCCLAGVTCTVPHCRAAELHQADLTSMIGRGAVAAQRVCTDRLKPLAISVRLAAAAAAKEQQGEARNRERRRWLTAPIRMVNNIRSGLANGRLL